MESKSKQHIVPRFYLSRFTENDDERSLYAFDKIERHHFKTRVYDAGCENDFYTLELDTAKYIWDDFYTDFESDISLYYKSILSNLSNVLINENVQLFDLEVKKIIGFFIVLQLTRGHKYIDFVNREFDAFNGSMLDNAEKKKEISLTVVNKDLLIQYLLQLINRTWIFYCDTRHKLIVGDEPICLFDINDDSKQGLLKCHLTDKNTIITMPITSYTLLVMYHPFVRHGALNGCDRQKRYTNDGKLFNRNNRGIYEQSSRFIYGSDGNIIRDIVKSTSEGEC